MKLRSILLVEPGKHTVTEEAPPPAKPSRSDGEKRFDRLVYAGLNGVGTFIITLPFAYWAKYGGGAKAFEKAGTYLETKNIVKNAKDALMSTALGIGGTVMLIPVHTAEQFRKPLVHLLRSKKDDALDVKDNSQNQPPQTWGSLLLGRLVAWCAVFASFKIVGSACNLLGKPQGLDYFENKVAEKVVSARNVLSKPFGKAAIDVKNTETKLYRYGKLAALDVFATIAASILLYTGSHFFARRNAKKQTLEDAVQTTRTSASEPEKFAVKTDVTTSHPETKIQGNKDHQPLMDGAALKAPAL